MGDTYDFIDFAGYKNYFPKIWGQGPPPTVEDSMGILEYYQCTSTVQAHYAVNDKKNMYLPH